MDAVDRDSIAHAISQVMGFYNRPFDQTALHFWLKAMADFDPDEILAALEEYTQIGKHAPKPVDIRDLITARRTQHRNHHALEEIDCNPAPKHIADAWRWFIGLVASGSPTTAGLYADTQDIDLPTQERYLVTVNQEAKRLNQPESIPPEYRVAEVWA